MDFKTELIRIVERDIPELASKIQIGAVDAQTAAPYALLSTPPETPIRTFDGIVGYDVTFEMSIFHTRLAELESLKIKLINTLEGAALADNTSYYKTGEYDFFHEYNLHSYSLTFQIS